MITTTEAVLEQFILAWCAQFLERWGFEQGITDVSPWSPPAVQAAWQILVEHMGEEAETAVACWAEALSSPKWRGAPS
jgi:hypothetical protein